ncbi:MAG: ArsA family ATPase [Leptolyngbya sp. RL_3_1]|nr:ArsA family ATPase [Leptolyngbya sp. RL_3_1]
MVPIQLPQLALISGKGGVGKTTFACGCALAQARQHPGETVLLLSTDPAHSLGDVLQLEVDDAVRPHPEYGNLHVRALDAEHLLQSFKARYGNVLETLVERGSFVDDGDLSPVWDMNWPGLNELMGLLEIQRILRDGEADRVIVDMAPSGHTLNLLGLMDFLDTFLVALQSFQDKHQYLIKTLSGRYTPDQADQFLATMGADLAAGRAQLQGHGPSEPASEPASGQRTACWIVALAEPLSVRETERFLDALQQLQIPCGGLVVNRLTHSPAQITQLTAFTRLLPDRPVLTLPQWTTEPVGTAALLRLIEHLTPVAEKDLAPAAAPTEPVVWPQPLPPGCPDFVSEGRRLVIVGGKGGVGKTTVSAAIATALAQHHPDAQIRVVSIDPAHSLGDVFETPLGHTPNALRDNLRAQEVSAAQVLDRFREDYLWELAEMMAGDSSDGTLQVVYGPEGWRQIVTQALPGIDEMLSLITVMDLLEQDSETLIVLDTAPTGHLLQFLEMPVALGEWLSWIFKLWIKYQDVVGRVELIGRLRQLRKRVMVAQKRLTDTSHTEFIGVVQNQSAVLAEAQRLTATLAERGVAQRFIVHNRYGADTDRAAATALAQRFPQQTILPLPLLPEVSPRLQVAGAAHLLFPWADLEAG